ncbi:hypothetical protein CC80DRAFT_593332 [Byssothecium circinans]|uniref:Uncharacterized protein n=1 Tax=Byssothecium circinans TaxID=147558 RepID=A0A6A5TUJ1_9PLEO|nr:hypothetical protein CC80DRAFT_593332 [Byssothecium circinans]
MTSAPPSAELQEYQRLLSTPATSKSDAQADTENEHIKTSPLVWWDVKEKTADTNFQQYGVLGHIPSATSPASRESMKPILLSTNAPWSAFLCGSQGSRKSYTLSCMLENCLLKDETIGRNPKPLAGIVFHYDSLQGSGVREAAYMCERVETRVLVSESNYGRLKKLYEEMAEKKGGSVVVEKLKSHSGHLDTERMKTLMVVGKEGEMPLYMHSAKKNRDILTGTPGVLTIIDLTDPVIDADFSCVLFDICLSIFLSQTKCSKIIALDEAHNYMTASSAAENQFT